VQVRSEPVGAIHRVWPVWSRSNSSLRWTRLAEVGSVGRGDGAERRRSESSKRRRRSIDMCDCMLLHLHAEHPVECGCCHVMSPRRRLLNGSRADRAEAMEHHAEKRRRNAP
jgi:hypothetical protein